MQSEEHSNQLARYYGLVAKECSGSRIVPIYLTKEAESPSDERFIAYGYDQVCDLVEKLIILNGSMLDRGVRIVVAHYAEMLRRYIVTESEIAELCHPIYAKHKQALDLIYEHRPDRQQMVRELLEGWWKSSKQLRNRLGFTPQRAKHRSKIDRSTPMTPSGLDYEICLLRVRVFDSERARVFWPVRGTKSKKGNGLLKRVALRTSGLAE